MAKIRTTYLPGDPGNPQYPWSPSCVEVRCYHIGDAGPLPWSEHVMHIEPGAPPYYPDLGAWRSFPIFTGMPILPPRDDWEAALWAFYFYVESNPSVMLKVCRLCNYRTQFKIPIL